MLPASTRLDHECFELPWLDSRQVPHTEGIARVGLLNAKRVPIPPRASTAPGADGKTKLLQGFDHLEAGSIDGCGILEWRFGLSFHFGMPPFGSGEVAFGGITIVTTQYQIADAIGTPARTGDHMINLEGHLASPTIHAPILVFEEQIGSYLPSCKCSLLVLHPADLRVLEQLGVETHPLNLDATHGDPLRKPFGPSQHIAHARKKRGR